MFVQRLNNKMQFSEKYIDFFISMKQKHENSFDEVWLSTPVGFPSLDFHRQCACKLAGVADRLRDAGINVSLQLANTLGHGSYIADYYDCSYLKDKNIRPMVDAAGTVGIASSCWNDGNFREYLFKVAGYYAHYVKPDIFWIDDDFRAVNHNPVRYGCFCPDCINKFNKTHGYNFSRGELAETILHKDIKVRNEWIDMIRSDLGDLMYNICQHIHLASPHTEFGLQNFCNGAYTGYGLSFLTDKMKAVNGKNPHYRAGGGAYQDHNPNDFLLKSMQISFQNSTLSDVSWLAPEIENLPDVVFGKTPAGTAFETSFYLANGANGMTYAMVCNDNESNKWHEREFSILSSMRPYWDRLAMLSDNSVASGITYFISAHAKDKKLAENQGFEELSDENIVNCLPFYRLGIPLIFENGDDLFVLRPEVAGYISSGEFEFLKSKNVITCGESVAILKDRGFELPVISKKIDEKTKLSVFESYTDADINGKQKNSFSRTSFDEGHFAPYYLDSLGERTAVLGLYRHYYDDLSYINGKKATLIVSLNEGGSWAVFGYSLWSKLKTSAERDRILNIADYIGVLNARIISAEQAALSVRKSKYSRKTIGVSVTNCSIGVQKNVKVLIKNAESDIFYLDGQYRKFRKTEGRQTKGGVIVTIPKIEPWSVSTVFIGEKFST